MVDSKNYQDWYYKAKNDLKSAKILFEAEAEGDNIDYSIPAFHSQQCIEKYLKGYILKETGVLSAKGHNLSVLCNKAIKYDISFKKYTDDCDYVNDFYIETRYPVSAPLIKKHEAKDCIDIATKIADFVLSL